jgi:hypothetical protein
MADDDRRREMIDKLTALATKHFGPNEPSPWVRLFDFYDGDRDGRVTRKEALEMLGDAGIGMRWNRDQWVSGLFAAMERSPADDAVSRAELETYLLQHPPPRAVPVKPSGRALSDAEAEAVARKMLENSNAVRYAPHWTQADLEAIEAASVRLARAKVGKHPPQQPLEPSESLGKVPGKVPPITPEDAEARARAREINRQISERRYAESGGGGAIVVVLLGALLLMAGGRRR